MKKIILAVSLLTISVTFAQQLIEVKVDSTMVNRVNQSFSVDIPQVTLKDVKNDWLKYTAKGSSGKASVVNEEYIQTGAVNKNIAPGPFTVYSKIIETPAGVRLTAWLSQNNIVSASGVANSNQNLAVQKYMRDFAVMEYQDAVKAELKKEQNKLATLEKGLADLIKSEEKSTKTMSANGRSNERADDKIATNRSDIKSSSDKIEDQKDMVQKTAADPNASKGAKKTLAELESDKRDLQKENDKQSKKIENRK